MCGIAGIYGLEGLTEAASCIQKMTDALAHRGPDASGTKIIDNVALGHRRLSIIDLSASANQPFVSPNGRSVLIFNGEIYNYQEIREELSGYDFVTNGDTEVVLAALEKWGSAALQKFNGMFALAFYQGDNHELLIARDRAGIKPLYYAEVDGRFLFASEVRSLLESGLVARAINTQSIDDYLRYQTVHAPRTMIKDVKILEAGHILTINDNERVKRAFWKPWQTKHFDTDPTKIKKEIRDRLTQSVERRLISDVPFGAFLSGGIDSSLLVGIISDRLGKSIDTFNVSFDEGEYSEAVYAKAVAKRFGTKHHEILLKPDDFLHALPEALNSMDHPSGDGPNTWVVSRETKKQGITMALSGLGGDELFGGYDVFKRIPDIAEKHWILSFPKPIRSLVGSVLELKSPGIASSKTKEILKSDYFDLEHLYPIFRKVLLDDRLQRLTNTGMKTNRVQALISELERYPDFVNLPTLSRISVAEMETYMQHVLLRDSDQMSMAHALELRVPFLDHELIEYAMHIPDLVKYPHTPKKLLVDSFENLLPDDVVHRQKMGFVLPWEVWMRGPLKSLCADSIDFLKDSGQLNADALTKLWEDFLSNHPSVSWSRVWPLVTLAQWMKNNNIE